MSTWGLPETYGVRPDGHCGHCNGLPEHAAESDWGSFCLACFRWRTYTGPPQTWGDGMRVTQPKEGTTVSEPTTFDPGQPITNGDLLEDMDGAPLPHELQTGGAIYEAVCQALVAMMIGDTVTETAADVMRELTPVLWPLLPSNDHGEPAKVEAVRRIVRGHFPDGPADGSLALRVRNAIGDKP